MPVYGASPYVQNSFNDQFGLGYAGQLASQQDYAFNNNVKSFSVESPTVGNIWCGRAVAKGTAQDFTDTNVATLQPYTVRPLEGTDDATALVGICVRPFVGAVSFEDAVDSQWKAGFDDKSVAPILLFGSRQRIYVRQSIEVGAVTSGAAVYVATDATNAAGLLVGEFGVAAQAEVDKVILVPNAVWVFTKSTATASDQINAIDLL